MTLLLSARASGSARTRMNKQTHKTKVMHNTESSQQHRPPIGRNTITIGMYTGNPTTRNKTKTKTERNKTKQIEKSR